MSKKVDDLYEELAKAEKANDHERSKHIIERIREEQNKDSLMKWVWYR